MEDSESAEIDQLNVPNSPPTEPSKNSLQVGNRELTPEEACKASKISSICENGHDIHALICLATTKYGLVHDEVRRKACMFVNVLCSLAAHAFDRAFSPRLWEHHVGKGDSSYFMARSALPEG